MDVQQEAEGDYLDRLQPGYRFCPTDAELIVHYLQRKIDTGEHPECRLYNVKLNDHDPQVLADGHRSCDGKWYFLTSRDRKYTNGKRPSRIIKTGGYWRTSQADAPVYDDVGQLVGRKRCFAHFDTKKKKTQWLMHEYITNHPDLPIGTHGNKLSDCVLCKIYKKEIKRTPDNTNEEEPSPKRLRQVQTQEENHHQLVPSNQELVHDADTPSALTEYAQDQSCVDTTNLLGYDHEDQTLPMVVQEIEDIFNFDNTSGLMGYDQTLSQDDNFSFDHGLIMAQMIAYSHSIQDELVQHDHLGTDDEGAIHPKELLTSTPNHHLDSSHSLTVDELLGLY